MSDKELQISVRLRQTGEFRTLAPRFGETLRELLLRSNCTPYRGVFRQFNCQGLGICGSCTVWKREGTQFFARRSCQIRCFQPLEIELE